jgi:galactokinase
MDRSPQVMAAYKEKFGADPKVVVRAPGRVNLIGEHTDYNEGFVFPTAIDREMIIAASPKPVLPPADAGGEPVVDNEVVVYSLEYRQEDRFSIMQLEKSASNPWVNYLRGVLLVMRQAGHKIAPCTAVISGNIPPGAGLSSSAAYEVAVATLQSEMNGLKLPGKEIALLAQKAENQFVGVRCGIMDQFISALGEKESAMLLDCRSLNYRTIPLNLKQQSVSIVITNSGVQRGLVDSEYNLRRQQCHEGVEILKKATGFNDITTLRDVVMSEFEEYGSALPPVILKRCRHVISENERCIRATEALEGGDLKAFGRLMNDSHRSLQQDYQVSCTELDVLVQLTQTHPGVIGSRMTGAGFGGCSVTLMQTSAVEGFVAQVIPQYEAHTGKKAEVYVCSSVSGACIVAAPAIAS